MITSNSLKITVEPSQLSISLSAYDFKQPGSCTASLGQLCSGGSSSMLIHIAADLSTTYQLVLANDVQSIVYAQDITTDASGNDTVTVDTGSLNAVCFLGSCLGNCAYYYNAYLYPPGSCTAGTGIKACSKAPLVTSAQVKITIDCSCTC